MRISFAASVVALLCATQASAEVVCTPVSAHLENPCEEDVESPEIEVTPSPTGSPTLAPTEIPTSKPSFSLTSSPTTSPTTPAPTLSPTETPSDVPSVAPSTVPSFGPSAAPTTFVCATQDGVFGDIESEVDRTIEYGYEVEATVDADLIESDILPLVEKAVTDSILAEIFAQCAVRRKVRRRLEITGVTQNPEDLVLDDIVCGDVADGNSCVVVSGALAVFASDEESASSLEDAILAAIKANMDSGSFNDVHESVVRVTYTELQSGGPSGSEGSGGNSAVGTDNNTPVLVGSLVAAGVLMAAVLAVAYTKRNKNENDLADATATDIGGEESEIGGGGQPETGAGEPSEIGGGERQAETGGGEQSEIGGGDEQSSVISS